MIHRSHILFHAGYFAKASRCDSRVGHPEPREGSISAIVPKIHGANSTGFFTAFRMTDL
jgi:hypothetical protein